ncbi:MAG TPA: type II CAAX endopeptidase family protein [Bacillus sp. (in: firmicutes)]|nr:type II CAAX endopeptidase family protein [Bacillus sp. (in: firmicutes)]
MNHQIESRTIFLIIMFGSLLIFIQTYHYPLLGVWGIFAILSYVKFGKTVKSFIITNLLFGIRFSMYLYVITRGLANIESPELHLFLNRLSLGLIIIPFLLISVLNKAPLMKLWNRPMWNEFIHFPFIWSGFHKAKIKFFLPIALIINVVVMMPFMVSMGWLYIQEIWILAVIFAVTNATFEELIWRGVLLTRFSEHIGEKGAVLVTSLGFGLQHYSLGFSWLVCIGFAVGGLFYGGITVKSRSILPAWIWHIVLNFLMVFSGVIL